MPFLIPRLAFINVKLLKKRKRKKEHSINRENKKEHSIPYFDIELPLIVITGNK